MDWWASLEHKIRYKKDLPLPDALEKELLECANISEELDQRMENLQIIADSMAKNTG
jgi:putative GTP pyrophosphokinase